VARQPSNAWHPADSLAHHYSHAEHHGKNDGFFDAEPHHPMAHVNPRRYGSETAISEKKSLESRVRQQGD